MPRITVSAIRGLQLGYPLRGSELVDEPPAIEIMRTPQAIADTHPDVM